MEPSSRSATFGLPILKYGYTVHVDDLQNTVVGYVNGYASAVV